MGLCFHNLEFTQKIWVSGAKHVHWYPSIYHRNRGLDNLCFGPVEPLEVIRRVESEWVRTLNWPVSTWTTHPRIHILGLSDKVTPRTLILVTPDETCLCGELHLCSPPALPPELIVFEDEFHYTFSIGLIGELVCVVQ